MFRRNLILFITCTLVLGSFTSISAAAKLATPGDASIGTGAPAFAESGTTGLDSIHSSDTIFGVIENGKTTIALRVCGQGPHFQLRSENINQWITEVFYRTAAEGGCSPSPTSWWKMVINADAGTGEQFRIYATAYENPLSEQDFMERARRYICTVPNPGQVSCNPELTTAPQIVIDTPAGGAVLQGTATVRGWAVDKAASGDTGVTEAHVRVNGAFLGAASYGESRPDVATHLGDSRFTASQYNYSFDSRRITNGAATLQVSYHIQRTLHYTIQGVARSSSIDQWHAVERPITINNPNYPLMVFNDANYSGTWCYSDAPITANIYVSCNDQISSISLYSGWSMRAYRDQNQAGPNVCLNASDPWLGDNSFTDGSSLDNSISSFILYNTTNCGATAAPPDAPGSPIATAIGENSVSMRWSDNSNNEDGFKIYRWDAPDPGWIVVGTVGANATTFTATGLACGTRYFFNINAYNAYGETPAPWTGWLEVTTNACPVTTYTISGRVTDGSGTPLGGVTISDGARATLTNSTGNYALSSVPAGNYSLTPARSGYSFNPVARTVSVAANLSEQNFIASPLTYTIGGRVTDGGGVAISGVVVSNGARTATTDANGNYRLSNVPAGNYVLTPSKLNVSFTPASRSVTVAGNLVGQDFSGAPTAGMVDVTISLYGNPTTAQARAPYEAIIRYFADGIFEQSNGAHKLRTVTIYPNRGQQNTAHIQWIADCWPNAHISGYGTPGLRVQMCDTFLGTNFLAEHDWGGYVLAHEWGHFYYSLYDEYRGGAICKADAPGWPCRDDTPVNNSIMHSQWNARGGNYAWLNFSTALNNTRNTAQHRMYWASGWETLARPPSQDPRSGVLQYSAQRLYYPSMAAFAPAAGQSPRIDLVAGNTARSNLNIVWGNSTAELMTTQSSFSATVHSMYGGQITYPAPIVVQATLQRERPIIGAVAEGMLLAPDGSSTAFAVRDDGVAPDRSADDGLYTGLAPYTQNGEHQLRVTFNNSAGIAEEIFGGGELAPPLPGTPPILPAPSPVQDSFEVAAEFAVQIAAVRADDYGNTPAAAHGLAADNLNTPGIIEAAGDKDLFRFMASETGTLAIRVTNMALGMRPQFRLLADDGVTELARATLTSTAPLEYLFVSRSFTAGDVFYVEVSDQDPAAIGGSYVISAGTPLINESALLNRLYLPLLRK